MLASRLGAGARTSAAPLFKRQLANPSSFVRQASTASSSAAAAASEVRYHSLQLGVKSYSILTDLVLYSYIIRYHAHLHTIRNNPSINYLDTRNPSHQSPPIYRNNFARSSLGVSAIIDISLLHTNDHYNRFININYGLYLVPPHLQVLHRSLLPPLRWQSLAVRLSIWDSRSGKSQSHDSCRRRFTRPSFPLVSLWSLERFRPRKYQKRLSSLQRSMLNMSFIG